MSNTADMGTEAGKASEPEPETERDPLLGRTLAGVYRIEGLLGAGGIGRVYRAEQMTLRRSVAIKVLLDEYQRIPNLKQRFEREAMTLARLSHPNIVTILDFRSVRDQTFLVMELVEGEELSALLQNGALPPKRAFAIMRQILRCLAYAHAEGVIHRDLKPANVLVRVLPDGSDHVEMLDFGLAKVMDGEGPGADLTRSGLILGTPAYMAPEQGSGSKADPRSDVYAAGLLFHEMLTGLRPFEGDDPADLIRAHLITPPPPLDLQNPGLVVPEPLRIFVERALGKAPAERFADGQEMLEAFDALPVDAVRWRDAPEGVLAPPSIGLDETRPVRSGSAGAVSTGARTEIPHRRRGRGLWAVVGVAVVALAAAAGFLVAWNLAGDLGLGSAPEVPGPVALVAAVTGADDEEDDGFDDELVDDPGDDEGEDPEDPSADGEGSQPAETGADAVGSERPLARNPWGRRLPRPRARIRSRLKRGQTPSQRQLRPLSQYRRQHPGDIRAPLLLAHVYAARGWLSAALDQYKRVYERDPSVRGDPRMRRDLIRMAAAEATHEAAVEAVVAIYGPEALDRVDQEIARTSDPADEARLRTLRARLAPAP